MGLRVAVAGASGYAGGEILRLAAAHPEFDVVTVTGHTSAGRRMSQVQPHLRSLGHLVLQQTSAAVLQGHDVVFLALPHGRSGALGDDLGEVPLIVDVGADHRLTDSADWAAYYTGDWHGAWTYGIPELPTAQGAQRQALVGARRVAAPGCNASAVSLALAPAVAAGLVHTDDLVAVLAVGPSGAGRMLRDDLLAAELLGSAHAYALGGTHRHTPEILQNLALATGRRGTLSFTPVLVPMARGVLATSTARLVDGVEEADVREAYGRAYDDERFVHVTEAGVFPAVQHVLGSNTVAIGLAVDRRAGRLVTVAALDNLVKGTAGAAVQSANIALGLDEATGLAVDGVAP